MPAYERKDHYYRRAKREGKASRAVYKLSELQQRFRLVKRGDAILDLGSAPGGWMQELVALAGPSGKVIGVDLLSLKIQPPKGAVFVQGDLGDEGIRDRIEQEAGGLVKGVFSDISPNLSGIAYADAYRSYELATIAFDLCEKLLAKGGHFVVKIFPGDEFPQYIARLKGRFEKVHTVTPEATRRASSERYLVCLRFRR